MIIPLAFSAECNKTSAEIFPGEELTLTSSNYYYVGFIYTLAVTPNALYINCWSGEWAKLFHNGTLKWAMQYGIESYSQAVSTDETYLISSANNSRLFKINTVDGSSLGAS